MASHQHGQLPVAEGRNKLIRVRLPVSRGEPELAQIQQLRDCPQERNVLAAHVQEPVTLNGGFDLLEFLLHNLARQEAVFVVATSEFTRGVSCIIRRFSSDMSSMTS